MEFTDNGPGLSTAKKDEVLERLNTEISDDGSGFARIVNLLHPYNPKYEINSLPGRHCVKIMIPV